MRTESPEFDDADSNHSDYPKTTTAVAGVQAAAIIASANSSFTQPSVRSDWARPGVKNQQDLRLLEQQKLRDPGKSRGTDGYHSNTFLIPNACWGLTLLSNSNANDIVHGDGLVTPQFMKLSPKFSLCPPGWNKS